jgi:hypothetical protein
MSHPRQQITRQRHNENIIHIDKHPQLLEKSEQKTDLNEVNTTSYQSEDKPAENINVIVASRRFLCWQNGLSLTILIVTYSEALMNTEHQQKPKRRKTACLFARMRDGREVFGPRARTELIVECNSNAAWLGGPPRVSPPQPWGGWPEGSWPVCVRINWPGNERTCSGLNGLSMKGGD